jgi:hypothetical protein
VQAGHLVRCGAQVDAHRVAQLDEVGHRAHDGLEPGAPLAQRQLHHALAVEVEHVEDLEQQVPLPVGARVLVGGGLDHPRERAEAHDARRPRELVVTAGHGTPFVVHQQLA